MFEHYLRSREALMHLKMTLLNSPDQIGKESRFWGMTSDEVGDAFGRLAKELDIQINLLLVASSEARLRVDFLDRVKKRGKDSISRRFREIEQRRKARAKKGVRLEDILEAWANELTGRPGGNSAGPMGRLFLYRHWIAHGRYWVENKSGLNQPDPYEIWGMIRRFFNSFSEFEPLPGP